MGSLAVNILGGESLRLSFQGLFGIESYCLRISFTGQLDQSSASAPRESKLFFSPEARDEIDNEYQIPGLIARIY